MDEAFINVDFADVTSVMANAGYAHMGIGSASGKDKAEQAAREAISSPLLETSIKGAQGILISMSVSPDVSLEDAELASTLITSEAGPDANIIWGVSFDTDLEDEMRVTVIATGFEKQPGSARRSDKTRRTDRFAPLNTASDAKSRAAAQPKPSRRSDDDDFSGLFDMMRSTKK